MELSAFSRNCTLKLQNESPFACCTFKHAFCHFSKIIKKTQCNWNSSSFLLSICWKIAVKQRGSKLRKPQSGYLCDLGHGSSPDVPVWMGIFAVWATLGPLQRACLTRTLEEPSQEGTSFSQEKQWIKSPLCEQQWSVG